MVKSENEDDEAGKIFVGGLSWETTQEKLQEYFTQYGEVSDCVVMMNTETGKSRGFGFVTFQDVACVAKVLSSGPHELDNRTIDPKVCSTSKDGHQGKKSGQHPKIFLGGLPPSTTETDIRSFFSRYGTVVEVVLMYDQEKKKSRGFGFLSFETEDSCKQVCAEHFVKINGKKIECKHAEPRDKKRLNQHAGPSNQQWGTASGGWGNPSGNAQTGASGSNMGSGQMGSMNNSSMMGPGYQGGWGPGPYGVPGGWGPQPGFGPGFGWGYGPGFGPPGPGFGQPGYGYGYGYGYGGPMGGPGPNPPAPGTENFQGSGSGANNNNNNNNNNNPPPNNNNNNNAGNNNNNNNNPPSSSSSNQQSSPGQSGPSPPGMGNYNQENSNFGAQRGAGPVGPGYGSGPNNFGGPGNFPQGNFGGNQGDSQNNRPGYHPYRR